VLEATSSLEVEPAQAREHFIEGFGFFEHLVEFLIFVDRFAHFTGALHHGSVSHGLGRVGSSSGRSVSAASNIPDDLSCCLRRHPVFSYEKSQLAFVRFQVCIGRVGKDIVHKPRRVLVLLLPALLSLVEFVQSILLKFSHKQRHGMNRVLLVKFPDLRQKPVVLVGSYSGSGMLVQILQECPQFLNFPVFFLQQVVEGLIRVDKVFLGRGTIRGIFRGPIVRTVFCVRSSLLRGTPFRLVGKNIRGVAPVLTSRCIE
jgi:hypothetical protein